MATDKLEVKLTIEDAKKDFVLNYTPFYSGFMGSNEVVHEDVISKTTYRRATTLGEVKAEAINSQDSTMKHAKSGMLTKAHNSYPKGIQYVQSSFQDNNDLQRILNLVTNSIIQQEDVEFINGDSGASAYTPTTGTDANVINNGIALSNDPDYVKKASVAIASATAYDSVKSLILDLLDEINVNVSGLGKFILPYGSALITLLNKSVSATDRTPIQQALVQDINDTLEISTKYSKKVGLGGNGFIILTPDALSLHRGMVTTVESIGYDERNKETWANIFYMSKSIEVLAKGAALRQPVTIS